MSRIAKPKGKTGGAPKAWRPMTEDELRLRVDAGEFNLYALQLHTHPKDAQGNPLATVRSLGGKTIRMPYLHVVHDLRRIKDSDTWKWQKLDNPTFFNLLHQHGLALRLRTVGAPKVAVVNDPALSFRKPGGFGT